MARIGLFGGSFNPPTLAHIAMAQQAYDALDLDQLHWIVSPHNPEKDTSTLAPFQDRLNMVRIAIKDLPGMSASDVEQRLGSSWTTSTLRHIRKQYPDDHLFFIMGADNWHRLHLWGDDYPDLFHHASLVVLQRPGSQDIFCAPAAGIFHDKKTLLDKLEKFGTWAALKNEHMAVSATHIREQLHNGEVPDALDPAVLDYILEHNLYRAA